MQGESGEGRMGVMVRVACGGIVMTVRCRG